MTLGLIFFIFLLSSLVFVHTYLALNNLTTWELLSWNTVTYLEKWPRKYGSPFGKSTKYNLVNYFFSPAKGNNVQLWEMPTCLPTFVEGEALIKAAPMTQFCAKIY
mmetsp:Transcript_16247/g.14177  ORF Transcript_16247/g.14177 Transcript_16247/m.14177 type:complete len:106 (-) Transcript_16247:4-321(-)